MYGENPFTALPFRVSVEKTRDPRVAPAVAGATLGWAEERLRRTIDGGMANDPPHALRLRLFLT
jgi:hypothetical protein